MHHPPPLPLLCARLSMPTHQVSSQVLVWHTRTEKVNLANEPKYHLDTVTVRCVTGLPCASGVGGGGRRPWLLSPLFCMLPYVLDSLCTV